MTKILIITPHKRNCNSWWRSVGPFQHLEKMTDREIQIDVVEENFTWDVMCRYDIIFFHRPFRPDHLEGLQVAKQQNIPVWVDYDDWLFELPKWNSCAGLYSNTQIKMIMSSFLACADLVTCSTRELQTRFMKVNGRVIVLPNADRPDLFPYRTEEQTPRNDIFFWRGTDTHDGDLESVFQALTMLPKPTYFLGSPLWRVIDSMPEGSVKVMGEQDTFQYFKYIHDLKPKVMLFPLADNTFNRCKSNIAYLEAIHAGAICVAPNWPEWKHPGVINYGKSLDHDQPLDLRTSEQSFLEAAKFAMEISDEAHRNYIGYGRKHIAANFSMNVVNDHRITLISELLSSTFKRNDRDPFCQMTQMWSYCHITGTAMAQVGDATLQEKHLTSE